MLSLFPQTPQTTLSASRLQRLLCAQSEAPNLSSVFGSSMDLKIPPLAGKNGRPCCNTASLTQSFLHGTFSEHGGKPSVEESFCSLPPNETAKSLPCRRFTSILRWSIFLAPALNRTVCISF